MASDQVQEIKQKVDIVEIIGNRVSLKNAGKYFKGLCPFHAEKSPSFFVSPELQIFKCFGCSKSGDVFSFLEEYEGSTFREVLEELAQKTGVKLESYQPDKQTQEADQLLQILNLATEFYHYLLLHHPAGQAGRDYLKKRQIGSSLIKEFKLGFAPDDWRLLTHYLTQKKKFLPELVVATGLAIKSERGAYDRFRNRLVFPLSDFRGQVVGLSGRTLNPDPTEAKYINTPETKLYHKRELLFGLYQARPHIRKKNQVVVVEGEFDVLSSIKAGVNWAVGLKGSALTVEQLNYLNRLTTNVVLCLDADTAGAEATKRGIEQADKLGFNIAIVPLLHGKDPDELAQSEPETWRNSLKKPQSIYEFYIDTAFKDFSQSGRNKKQVSQELVPILANISHPVEQSHYITVVAQKLQVSEDVIQGEIRRHQAGLPITEEAVSEKNKSSEAQGLDELEAELVSCWLQLIRLDQVTLITTLNGIAWHHPGLKRLVPVLLSALKSGRDLDLRAVNASLTTELQQLLASLYLRHQSFPGQVSLDQVNLLLNQVKTRQSRQHIQELTKQIGQLEAIEGNLSAAQATQLEELQQQLTNLIKQLRQ